MANVTFLPGTKVQINSNFFEKSAHGMIGTVVMINRANNDELSYGVEFKSEWNHPSQGYGTKNLDGYLGSCQKGLFFSNAYEHFELDNLTVID